MTPTRCPCCGAEMTQDLPLIDMSNNRLVWRNVSIPLDQKPAELLFALRRAFPEAVRHADLYSALWGRSLPGHCGTALSQIVSRANRAVGGLGCRVVNVSGVGYRLQVTP